MSADDLTEPGSRHWSERGPRRWTKTRRVADAEAHERLAKRLLSWDVKRAAGFRPVDDLGRPLDRVTAGQALTLLTCRGLVREPIEVCRVVVEPDWVAYSYRARPGHPVQGEEAFIVWADGAGTWLTIRSVSEAGAGMWRAAWPAVRIAQAIVRRRYFSVLRT